VLVGMLREAERSGPSYRAPGAGLPHGVVSTSTRNMSAGIETDSKDERRTEEPTLLHLFLQRKVALGVIVVLLATGVLLATSRARDFGNRSRSPRRAR
jgi:hypothetical protein